MSTYKIMAQYNDGNKLVTLSIVASILEVGEALKMAHALNDENAEGGIHEDDNGAIYYIEEEK